MEGRNYSGGISKSRSVEILITEDDISEPVKWCYQCREWLPLGGFGKDKYVKSGLKCECKLCNAASTAAYKQKKKIINGKVL